MANSYGRLRRLAGDWQARAEQDSATGRRHALVGDEFRHIANTRRNCAWELLKMLNELEKENPAEAGSTSAPQSDCEAN